MASREDFEDLLDGDPRFNHPTDARMRLEEERERALMAHQHTMALAEDRLLEIHKIQMGRRDALEESLKKIAALNAEDLEIQLKKNSLLRGNKELEEAIAELKKGEKGIVTEEMQERIGAMQTVLAQQEALNKLGKEGQTVAADVMRQAREASGAKLSPFDVRGQIDELKSTVSQGNITEPATILAILRKNPIMAALSLFGSQIPNMESRGLGISVPMLGRFQVPGSDFGNVIREGQVTGGGYREGIGARFDAWKMGVNPFDIMSKEVAQAIVKGVRSRGFTGELGKAFQDAVGDIYQDTGLDPEMLMGMGDQFARRNQLESFRQLIGGMDDLAKETNRSVDEIAQGFEELRKTFETFGGLASSSTTAQAFNETMNKAFPGMAGEEMAGMRGWLSNALPMLSGRPAAMALGPQMDQAMVGMTGALQGFSAGMEGMTQQQRREQLAVLASTPMFQGLTVDQIDKLLRDPDAFLEGFQENKKDATIEQGRAGGLNILERARQKGRPSIRDERGAYVSSIEESLRMAGYKGPQAKSLIAELQGAVDSRGDWTWNKAVSRAEKQIPRWAEFRGERRADQQDVQVRIGFKGRAAEILQAEWKAGGAAYGNNDWRGTRRATGGDD